MVQLIFYHIGRIRGFGLVARPCGTKMKKLVDFFRDFSTFNYSGSQLTAMAAVSEKVAIV
jgi:hypothetical protein